MSDYERGSGPVEIAGPTGRIIGVGGRQAEGAGDPEGSPARDEFLSALRAEQRSLAEDKAHVARMAPKWRAERQQRAEQAFEAWKAERQRRAARLFAELYAEEDQGFPPPSAHFRRGSS